MDAKSQPVAKAVEAATHAAGNVHDAIGRTRRIYGTALLTRGLAWVAIYAIARWLLEVVADQTARVAIALLPVPVFAWFLWTWVGGMARMDELERRIELEALAFAFPVAAVFLATLGLLGVALTIDSSAFTMRGAWLMMPLLYYIGLWRAERRYR